MWQTCLVFRSIPSICIFVSICRAGVFARLRDLDARQFTPSVSKGVSNAVVLSTFEANTARLQKGGWLPLHVRPFSPSPFLTFLRITPPHPSPSCLYFLLALQPPSTSSSPPLRWTTIRSLCSMPPVLSGHDSGSSAGSDLTCHEGHRYLICARGP